MLISNRLHFHQMILHRKWSRFNSTFTFFTHFSITIYIFFLFWKPFYVYHWWTKAWSSTYINMITHNFELGCPNVMIFFVFCRELFVVPYKSKYKKSVIENQLYVQCSFNNILKITIIIYEFYYIFTSDWILSKLTHISWHSNDTV